MLHTFSHLKFLLINFYTLQVSGYRGEYILCLKYTQFIEMQTFPISYTMDTNDIIYRHNGNLSFTKFSILGWLLFIIRISVKIK